ncbi:AP2-like ethylene-responsive transcription factor ail6, variant 2 [Lathyrus oleraceus]|uniref:AP2-like ethylene-responsive transcription factor ail6, variant 2 n=1 Tax=Pisum sativum TaxID=3888 RepID=A0A9D5AUR5_PEA|nr:AP2-like ethylene-responsive transcription factor ail6, variant 2 [Pisum sativum]
MMHDANGRMNFMDSSHTATGKETEGFAEMNPNSFPVYDCSFTSMFFNDAQDPQSIDACLPVSTTVNNFGSGLDQSELNTGTELGGESSKDIVAVDPESPENTTHSTAKPTSKYKGVSRHRWMGRFEAHLWDNNCKQEGRVRKGRQGGFEDEENAGRAHNLAALKYWGPTATTNFPVSDYAKELEEMKHEGKREFLTKLRRKSNGFARGTSQYRGVTRHHYRGKWQARIGRVSGNKDIYLGIFDSEEEAAEAYDIAALKYRGASAITNFEASRYDMEAISKNPLPIARATKRLRRSRQSEKNAPVTRIDQPQCTNMDSSNFQSTASLPYDPFHHFHPPTNTEIGTVQSAEIPTNAGTIIAGNATSI